MIVRIWHGQVPRAKAEEYMALMERVAIPDYRSTAGNLGAMALRRDERKICHVTMLTLWEGRDAIAAFAGEDIEVAKYYDFDRDFLLQLEPTVQHHDVTGAAFAPELSA